MKRLENRARELWDESPDRSLELVRTLYDKLAAEDEAGHLKLGRAVEIPTFGRFRTGEMGEIVAILVRLETALGYHDEALERFSAFGEEALLLPLKVDLLLRMGRRADAISLLEQKLHLDNWRGDLRRRLHELKGDILGGLN
jgi:hypothetical protein